MTSKPFRGLFRLEVQNDTQWHCVSMFATRDAAIRESQRHWFRDRQTRIIDADTARVLHANPKETL